MFPETLIPAAGFVIDPVIGATWSLFLSPVCLPTTWWQTADGTNARKYHSRFCVRKYNAIISHARSASCSVWVRNLVTVKKVHAFGLSEQSDWTRRMNIERFCFVFGNSTIQISTWRPDIPTEVVWSSPQCFQVRSGMLLQSSSRPLISTSFATNCSLTNLPPDPMLCLLWDESFDDVHVT